MTKTELKKINNATHGYLICYLRGKTDFNRDFIKLAKELGLLEQLMKDLLKCEVNSLCSITYSNLRYWSQNCAESIDYIALVYNEGCEGLPFTELLASAQYRYYLDELMWDYSKLKTINQLQILLNDLQSQDEE